MDLYYSNNCSEIYKYDGHSNYTGGHAVVIVGYGYENSKYYWLIQNSWGTNFCGDGFLKVEFGEIGIEKVVFLNHIYLKIIQQVKIFLQHLLSMKTVI